MTKPQDIKADLLRENREGEIILPQGKGGCPICGKAVVQKFRPFCSKRCADIDLHNWFSESYSIEDETTP